MTEPELRARPKRGRVATRARAHGCTPGVALPQYGSAITELVNELLNDQSREYPPGTPPLPEAEVARLSAAVLQDVRIYSRTLAGPEVEQLARSTRVAALLAKAADKRSDAEKNDLAEYLKSL